MANRNGYSPLSPGHGQGDSYDDDLNSQQQPPPYTLTEAPSSPYLAPQTGLQYSSPSAPPAPTSSSSAAAAAVVSPIGSSSATPTLYPQLHQQPAAAVPQSPPPQQPAQSPYQHHHQYPQNYHQPKPSHYQAIPAQEIPYHQQYYQQQQQQQYQQRQQTPQTHRPIVPGGHFGPAPVASSPLVLARPPTRIEDLKTRPGVVVCPCCHHLVLTETSTENGSCTYIGILALCLAGITSCGCCLFPLCMTSCKDIIHSCPNCQEEVGVYSRARARTIPL